MLNYKNSVNTKHQYTSVNISGINYKYQTYIVRVLADLKSALKTWNVLSVGIAK